MYSLECLSDRVCKEHMSAAVVHALQQNEIQDVIFCQHRVFINRDYKRGFRRAGNSVDVAQCLASNQVSSMHTLSQILTQCQISLRHHMLCCAADYGVAA